MKFVYIPWWKRTSRGSVLCCILGLLAGASCSLPYPYGLLLAALLLVASGALIDQDSVLGNSWLCVFAVAAGFAVSLVWATADSSERESTLRFLSITPWQILWIFPLQAIGFGSRIVIRRVGNRRSEEE